MEYRMQFDKEYNRTDFYRFLDGFLPDDFMHEDNPPVTIKSKMNYATKVDKLGYSKSLDLVVYEIKHQSKHDARVGLSKDAFRFLADADEDRALVIFVPEDSNDNYRFSYIEISLGVKPSGKLTRSYSNPHRFSYYLGEGIAYYTPNKYLNELGKVKDAEDLKGRFSVEVLTKAFYQELSDWYAWAIQIIKFPNDIRDLNDDRKYNNEGAIRLITRLIFIWFLKQRGLVPKEFFDENYIAENLLNDFQPNLQTGFFGYKSLESKYYKAILQNLFFAMLNSPITAEDDKDHFERRFRKDNAEFNMNKLMRYQKYFKNPQKFIELANQVPYLNGGLFDCLDKKNEGIYYDGFSDKVEVQKSLCVPDYLFFGEEAGKNIDLSEWYGDDNKKKVSARGIIDILKRYNFTVEENTPFDQEVSLDPELLGKVFENLLASYNPETQTTARKQTGSFYTPREIVQYMVDESLIAHLKRTVGDELESEYRKLVQYNDESLNLTDDDKNKIIESLYHCKVLDPACGSGAFPVGMLQQMVHILNQVDPDNEKWKNMMLNQAVDESKEVFKLAPKEEREEILKDINRSFDESINGPDYARKLYLIENCIYGVDIQPIAIQISKLRFFISLVVDQKTNHNPKENYGIRPLPNLEAKFVAANTLVELKNQSLSLFDSEEVQKKLDELKIANHKIFSAKTNRTKKKYEQRIKDLQDDIIRTLENKGVIGNEDAQQLSSWKMFDQNLSASFFDLEWMFNNKDGFDIIIGNPPYLKEGRVLLSVFESIKDSIYYCGKMDLWYVFACKGIDFLKNNGVLCFIATNNWVTNSGASILRNKVIKDTKILQLCDFGDFKIFESASIQTMVMLFEKNKKDDGYLFDYRRLFGDSCLNDVNLLLAKKINTNVEYLTPIVERGKFYNKYITFSSNDNLLNKIKDNCNIMYLSTNEMTNGIHPHFDFVNNKIAKSSNHLVGEGIFGLSDEELDNLHLSTNEYTLIKPYYNNSERVFRYYTNSNNPYWIIYTDSKFKNFNSMDQYPHLKEHLDRFADVITSDNKPYGLHRARKEHFFQNEKIAVLRKCSNRPLFSYSNFDCYLSATFYIIQTNRINMKYLTGLLNSKLVMFWLKNKGKMQGENYQLDKDPLMQIPIYLAEKVIQNKIAKLVEYVIELNQNTNQSISSYVDNIYISSVIEDIIDAVVYELYFADDFRSKSIEIFSKIPNSNNVKDFYEKIQSSDCKLLNTIKLMKIELNDLLMPIISL